MIFFPNQLQEKWYYWYHTLKISSTVFFLFLFLVILILNIVSRQSFFDNAENFIVSLNSILSEGSLILDEHENSTNLTNETKENTAISDDIQKEEIETPEDSIKMTLDDILENFKDPEYRKKFINHPAVEKAVFNLQKAIENTKQEDIDIKVFLGITAICVIVTLAGTIIIHYSFKNEIISFLNSLNLKKDDSSMSNLEKALKDFIQSCLQTHSEILKQEADHIKEILNNQEVNKNLTDVLINRLYVINDQIKNVVSSLKRLEDFEKSINKLLKAQQPIFIDLIAKNDAACEKVDAVHNVLSQLLQSRPRK